MRVAVPSVAAVALLACACAQPTAAPPEQGPAPPTGPPPPTCRAVPEGERLAQFAGASCPWVLVRAGEGVKLASLDIAAPPDASGEPPACLHASCRYEGADTPLGPMVIATEPAAESEVPRTVFLGVVVRQTELVFVDLWAAAGPAVVEDSTALGPAHALAPMKCGDDLGLFARARLPIGETTEPPSELRAREGILELRTSDTPKPGKHDGCTPLDLPLP